MRGTFHMGHGQRLTLKNVPGLDFPLPSHTNFLFPEKKVPGLDFPFESALFIN
jgi:hypothetical protein